MNDTYEDLKRRHTQGNGHNGDARRFRPVRFKEITLSTNRPYLVRNILPRDGLIVIWGPPKCGKTFWTLDLALHVALGRKYRGRRVHQGTVVYVASEGERGLSARIEAFRQAKLSPEDDDPPFYLLSSRLHLAKDVDQLIADIRVTLGDDSCVLIVIDTLNKTIGGSESDDRDMTAYIDAADKLRQAFSAAVAVIHHCGINETRPRGHTSLTGAVDAQHAVKKEVPGQVVTTAEFMKDGPEGETTVSRLLPINVGIDEDDEIITSLIIEPADEEQPPERTRQKLSDKQQITLDALRRAVAAHGEPAPAHNHIPPSAVVVSVDLWRRFYLAATKDLDGQDVENLFRGWRRHRDALQARKIIGTYDEIVWEA